MDADAATALRPDLVHCSITGWGPAGPLAEVPGYEAAVAAAQRAHGRFERQLRRGGPVFAAVPVAAHVAAQGAVQGIVAALFARARGGGAQRVETSLLQGVLPFDLVELLLVEMAERSGIEAPNILAVGGDLPTLNYHPVRTKDGRWIQCGNLLEHLLLAFLDATELLGELLADERFVEPPGMWDADGRRRARPDAGASAGAHGRRVDGDLPGQRQRRRRAVPHDGRGARPPRPRGGGDIVTLDDPVHGPVRTIGPIAELTATPAVIGPPAPTAGEHTAEVLAERRPTTTRPRRATTRRHRDGRSPASRSSSSRRSSPRRWRPPCSPTSGRAWSRSS